MERILEEDPMVAYEERDREILERMLDSLAPRQADPIGILVAETGRLLMDTPYVAHTLERENEILVVNLRELDCTTYAENCLAIARTVRGGGLSFDHFLDELKTIRYRGGEPEGYLSRLHYFCDWIRSNTEKGLVRECASEMNGVPFAKKIDFMSTHPESYIRLKQDPSLVARIREQEEQINQREMAYIPEKELGRVEDQLKEGDIVGITTDIEGLAVMHVGILVHVDGRIHLMHASSAAGKVVISEEPLSGYLKNSQRATGVMVARPI